MRATVALLLLSLLAASGARGQQPPTPPEATSAAQASMPDLGKGAEQVAAQLRQLTESLSDTAAFASLEAEVAADTHRTTERWNETGDLLKTNLRPTALDSLESSWQALRSQLDDVRERVDARVRRRMGDLETLAKLRESWARALYLAQKADAPAPVLERARSTLAAIDAVRPAIEQRHARVLVLQDSVSRALQICDDARARIDDARRQAIERIFVRQQPPVWSIGLAAFEPRRGGLGLAGDLGAKVEDLRIYTRAYWLGLVLTGLIILAFVLLLRRVRSRMRGSAGHDGGVGRASSVVETPVAAATPLGLLGTRPLRPDPPFVLLQIILVIAVTAAVFVLRPVLDARLAPAVYAAAALLVLNLASGLVELPPALEQVILIVELGATAVLLLWAAARVNRLEPGSHPPRVRAIGAAFMRVLALGCGASALAAAAGYLELAEFLGVGLFYALFVSFAILAGRVVLQDVVTLGLTRGPATRLHTVARHRTLLERRLRNAIDVGAVVLWLWIMLGHFDLLTPVVAVLQRVLDARLRVGELDLPVDRVLGFVAVVIGVLLPTRLAVMVLEDDVYSRMTLPRWVPYALSTLTRYGLLLTGFLLALGTLGFDLTRITVLLSALGLGIGFGLQ